MLFLEVFQSLLELLPIGYVKFILLVIFHL